MTLEELIRDGLDVEALPPGTVLILHARHPLDTEQMHRLADEARTVFEHLGIKGAVVSAELDVIPLPPEQWQADAAAPSGVPLGQEIRR